MTNKKYYIKNNDIKLTPKNLKEVVNFVSSQLEDEDGRGEYDEESGVIGAITNAVGHIVEQEQAPSLKLQAAIKKPQLNNRVKK